MWYFITFIVGIVLGAFIGGRLGRVHREVDTDDKRAGDRKQHDRRAKELDRREAEINARIDKHLEETGQTIDSNRDFIKRVLAKGKNST